MGVIPSHLRHLYDAGQVKQYYNVEDCHFHRCKIIARIYRQDHRLEQVYPKYAQLFQVRIAEALLKSRHDQDKCQVPPPVFALL